MSLSIISILSFLKSKGYGLNLSASNFEIYDSFHFQKELIINLILTNNCEDLAVQDLRNFQFIEKLELSI